MDAAEKRCSPQKKDKALCRRREDSEGLGLERVARSFVLSRKPGIQRTIHAKGWKFWESLEREGKALIRSFQLTHGRVESSV